CALETESRLEQRAVEVAHTDPGRVAMHLACAENQLTRERVVRELNGGQRPGERFPLAKRHTAPVPRRARPHEVEVRVVQRAADAVEVREQKIAIDQAVQPL